MKQLALALLLALAPTAQAQTDGPAQQNGLPEVKEEVSRRLDSDTPPPSAYDRAQQQTPGPLPEEGRTLASQLIRTVLSLLFVMALIWALARFGLARLNRLRATPSGKLAVEERLQLDQKNALYVVSVDGGGRLLVGVSAERGLSVLTTLQPAAPRQSFGQVLNDAAASGPDERSQA